MSSINVYETTFIYYLVISFFCCFVLFLFFKYANKIIQTDAEKLPCLEKSFSLTIYLTVEKGKQSKHSPVGWSISLLFMFNKFLKM